MALKDRSSGPLKRFNHILQVSKRRGLYVNLAYVRRGSMYFASFHGYAGGGAWEDGWGWIDGSGVAHLGSFSSFEPEVRFPEEYLPLMNQLDQTRLMFEHWGEDRPVLTRRGRQLQDHPNAALTEDGWLFRTPSIEVKVLRSISANWGLSISW